MRKQTMKVRISDPRVTNENPIHAPSTRYKIDLGHFLRVPFNAVKILHLSPPFAVIDICDKDQCFNQAPDLVIQGTRRPRHGCFDFD